MTKMTKNQLNKLTKEELVDKVLDLQNDYVSMENKLKMMNIAKYGRSTEKLLDPNQLRIEGFDNDVEQQFDEAAADEEAEETETVEVTTAEKKNTVKKSRTINFEKLEKILDKKVTTCELTEEELIEKFGENGWKRLPDQITRKLEVEPAKFWISEIHTAVYAAKDESKMLKASRPADLLKKSPLSVSLGTYLITNKYLDRIPLYHIESNLKDHGININRNTMASWLIKMSELYFSQIYDAMHGCLLNEDILMTDETPCYVTKDGKPAGSKSYMWLLRTIEFNRTTPIIYYKYQSGRAKANFIDMIEDWKGTLVSDAYSVYESINQKDTEITVANCWAHCRRKICDVVKSFGVDKALAKKSLAYEALEKIAAIYFEENKLKFLSEEERLKRRQTAVKCKVDGFFEWLKVHQYDTGKDDTSAAFSYCLNYEKELRVFLTNGNVPIDNNASEEVIRPLSVSRKIWKLIDTPSGAQSSAIMFSIIETAKANNLKVDEYIKYILTELPKHNDDTDISYIENFLPWSKSIPDYCKKPPIDWTKVEKEFKAKHDKKIYMKI